MQSRRLARWLLIGAVLALPAQAQESAGMDSTGSAWTGSSEQKLWGLMTVWAETKNAFPWFEAREGLDWDAAVRDFIPRVLAADDLETYYRVLSELVTLLEDSHTSVLPPWGYFTPGFDNPPISLQVIEGRFLVISVGDTDEIGDQRVYPGLEILEIGEGLPVLEYFKADVLLYRTMGSPQANEAILPFFLLYGPEGESVSLKVRDLDGGTRQISLRRSSAQRDGSPFFPRFIANMMESSITVRRLENGILYVAIPTFQNDQIRIEFMRLIDETDLAAINGMILDLRGNMGGSSATSNGIVSCLIDKTAPSPIMTYPLYAAAERAWGGDTQWSSEQFEVAPRDGKRYLGTLVLLTDSITHSSAEDVVIELLSTGRAIVVGGKTAGGAGNPIVSRLPGGGTLQVSTFRAAYPDGREYVGIGIKPDIEISPNQADIARGADPVLEKAIGILNNQP